MRLASMNPDPARSLPPDSIKVREVALERVEELRDAMAKAKKANNDTKGERDFARMRAGGPKAVASYPDKHQ